jgi:hypothetical protein
MIQISDMAVATLYSSDLTCIQNVPGSNFRRYTTYVDSNSSLFPQATTRIVLPLRNGSWLLDILQLLPRHWRADMLTWWQRHEFNNAGQLQFNIDTKQTDEAYNV